MTDKIPQTLTELTNYLIDFISYEGPPSKAQIREAAERLASADETEANAYAMGDIIMAELARLRKIYERVGI